MKTLLAMALLAPSLFAVEALLNQPSALAQVVCDPITNVQCELDLTLTIEAGNFSFEVPTSAVTVPFDAIQPGAVLDILVPVTNTSPDYNLINGTVTVNGMPAYITATAPPIFSLPSGATTTLTVQLTVGPVVPTTAVATTGGVNIIGDAEVSGVVPVLSY